MPILLGLDIGSNSVGSAWIDTDKQDIHVGVSVFPAGVDETEDKRGAPKNQDRRGKRSLRRTLARRSKRKRRIRKILTDFGMLPSNPLELRTLFDLNPWTLRRRGLHESLTPHEFGRALVHLGQRRGALGLKLSDPEDKKDAEDDQKSRDDAKVKAAIERTKQRIGNGTFGELMAIEAEQRRKPVLDADGQPRVDADGRVMTFQAFAIRNRLDSFEFHADRSMIRDEFLRLWERQSRPDGALSHLNERQREQLKQALDNPERDTTWRHKGLIFGQRNTYWDTGTLGRCDLEPTDRCVPIADRHASYYRVIESVNNIKIQGPGDHEERPLTLEERQKVIKRLRTQKTGSVSAVRTALKKDKRSLKKQGISENAWSLNIERDKDREINTDWFYREIVRGAISEDQWAQWTESKREGLNRAILKCDPAIDDDGDRLRRVAERFGLNDERCNELLKAWKTRPKLEKRLNLSRRAIVNLLPYMEKQLADGRWPTQIEARRMFAEDGDIEPTDEQRRRYFLGGQVLSKADRHYLRKHPTELPPAPMLSNPVVRKAIHEVRRHLIEHIRAHDGRKPDRITIEFAREASKPKKLSDRILTLNRRRNRIRKEVIEEVVKLAAADSFHTLSHNQLERAVDRVILARQQRRHCAYSGTQFGTITDFVAAKGNGLEIDHIIPYSRCGNNSWSNRVLCWQKANQDKGNKTPREWWSDDFDNRIRPMAFMDHYEPAKNDSNEYFTKRDYSAKWKNFTREDVPIHWRGSQLSDTAYASRQVQSYLHNALWSDEPSHLEGGQRRIFVTKGAYTAILRRDWQLYETLIDSSQDSPDQVREASSKNRGDHREHALDAVAIALTDSNRIDDLAHHAEALENKRFEAKERDRDPRGLRRQPLDPPWGNVRKFRAQVLRQIYPVNDKAVTAGSDGNLPTTIVVCHRAAGRRLVGAFHKDTLFGPVPDKDNTYVGRTHVYKDTNNRLKPAHLRLPEPEKKKDSIDRLTQEYLNAKIETSKSKARKRAIAFVEAPDFTPPAVDPSPGKSGLVRDLALRQRLRECIAGFEYTEKDGDGNINVRRHLDPDDFSAKEIKQAFEAGAIRHKSGVPIKCVKLLRTMTDPVVVARKTWDHQQRKWVRDTGKDGNLKPNQRSRADRAYDSQNNHHIEIRQHENGKWSGTIIRTFDAARRVRAGKQHPVDRSDHPEKGGRFIMSLAEGETLYMKHPDSGKSDYFVVFKLDKPQTIHLKHHWDARRDKGEKNEAGNTILNSAREDVGNGIPASKLRDLAPPGYDYPIKVRISPLGKVTRLEND